MITRILLGLKWSFGNFSKICCRPNPVDYHIHTISCKPSMKYKYLVFQSRQFILDDSSSINHPVSVHYNWNPQPLSWVILNFSNLISEGQVKWARQGVVPVETCMVKVLSSHCWEIEHPEDQSNIILKRKYRLQISVVLFEILFNAMLAYLFPFAYMSIPNKRLRFGSFMKSPELFRFCKRSTFTSTFTCISHFVYRFYCNPI